MGKLLALFLVAFTVAAGAIYAQSQGGSRPTDRPADRPADMMERGGQSSPGTMGQSPSGMMGTGGMMGSEMMGSGMSMMMEMMSMMRQMMGGMREGDMEVELYLRLRSQLNLTDEQVTSLESILLSVQKDRIRKGADVMVAELELNQLLDQKVLDVPKVEAKLKEAESLRTQARLSSIKALDGARKVLTEEQRKRVEALKSGSMMGGAGRQEMMERR
jgi:Spy/CpxP family protein refolding chaperone